MNFTVNTSEAVTVTGAPRRAIDVGGGTFTELAGNPLVIGNIGSNLRSFHGHVHTIDMGTDNDPIDDRKTVERWRGVLSGISIP